MIQLNTQEAKVLLKIFEGQPLASGDADTFNAIGVKLRNHRHLINYCEAVAHPVQPKEPA